MKVDAQAEHRWLHRLVGDWISEGEAVMGADKPPARWKSVELVRSLGGVWILAEGQAETPDGSESTTIMTLGYDPRKKRFVGTFIGSMMSNLWVYDGALDEAKKVLTLDTEGPNLAAEGTTAKFHDVIELKSDEERALSSYMQTANGEWQRIMTATYRRRA